MIPMIQGREDSFIRLEVQGISFYSCRAFENVPGLRHGFSTRRGMSGSRPDDFFNLGSVPEDAPGCLEARRKRFLSALNLEAAQLAALRQIHSDQVHIIRKNAGQWNHPEGDALVTQVAGIALAIQVADCLPVLITDVATKTVAAVHSGWRGTCARILSKTIRTMQEAFCCDPFNMLIAIGPAIRACCYEVGTEVAEKFEGAYPGFQLATPAKPGKYFLDLRQALDIQLGESNVPAGNVFDVGACTRCNSQQFHSYRADGERAGRMMAVIGYRA
jgi:YfiH family protein